MKRKRCGGATVHLTIIQPEIPHITQGSESIRSHDTRPRYRVPQVPQKTQLSELSFLPSLAFLRCRERRRCTASVLSPVSPLYYDRPFGRPQRHRAKPIPLRRGRNFFRLRKKYHDGACAVISRCRKATYHISLARYITLIRKELIYLENPKDTKSSIIAFRVTPEERAWIEKHSYGNYRIISDFVRDCVLKKDIVIVKGLDEFSNELRRIGNNLNQLTRAVNAGYVRAVDFTETKEEVEKLWQSLNSLLRDAP